MIDKTVAIVTGASRGIGRAIALKFARQGMAVALTARHEKNLKAVAKEIVSGGGFDPMIISADLRDLTNIAQISQQVMEKWGRIDILVNNAGLGYLKPFPEITAAEFQEMFDVNVRAVFFLTQQVLPVMVQRNSGMIINIASLAAKNGFKLGTGYAATKWALRGFAQCLLQEVREHDIRVITIFPGSVDTSFGAGQQSPAGIRSKNKILPEDIAEAAYFAYTIPPRSLLSEIDIRPTNPTKT